jgi:hypothetical protein
MNAYGSLCLSEDELYELTHRKRFSAQMRALNSMGIESRARPDRTLAVYRAHAEAVLSGGVHLHRTAQSAEPNWSD